MDNKKRTANEGYGMPVEDILKDMEKKDRVNPFKWFYEGLLGKNLDKSLNPDYDTNRVSAMAAGLPMNSTDFARDTLNNISNVILDSFVMKGIGSIFGTLGKGALSNYTTKDALYTFADYLNGLEKTLTSKGINSPYLRKMIYGLTKDGKKMKELHDSTTKTLSALEAGKTTGDIFQKTAPALVAGTELKTLDNKMDKSISNKKGLDLAGDIYSKSYINKNKDQIDPFLLEMYLKAYMDYGKDYNRGNPDYYAFVDVTDQLLKDFNKTADAKKFLNDVLSDDYQNLLGTVNSKGEIVRDFWDASESDFDKWTNVHKQMYTNKVNKDSNKDNPSMQFTSKPLSAPVDLDPESVAESQILADKAKRDVFDFRGYAPNYPKDPKNWAWR